MCTRLKEPRMGRLRAEEKTEPETSLESLGPLEQDFYLSELCKLCPGNQGVV